MKEKYSIGEISKISNLPITTLRYYDKIGLVKPYLVDENTNYRYYEHNQILTLNLIKYFRDIGFSIQDVKILLSEDKNILSQELLNKRYYDIDKELSRLQLVKDRLDAILNVYDSKKDQSINVKYLPKQMIVFSRYVGKATPEEIMVRYSKLFKVIETNNYVTNGEIMLIHHTPYQEYDINNVDIEVAVPVESPENEENIRVYGDMLVASTYHYGSYKTLVKTYKRIVKWLEDNDYVFLGNACEKYLIDMALSATDDGYVTEITLPIKKL